MLKDEHNFQKDGCRKVPSTHPLEHHPTYWGQNLLDTQDGISYIPSHKKVRSYLSI